MNSIFDKSSKSNTASTTTHTIHAIADYQECIRQLNTKNITHLYLTWALWAWKTTFVQQRADSLLPNKHTIDSPTYTYLNTYDETLLHIDMRRIEDEAQLQELGILEAIQQFPYVAIERPKWQERYSQPWQTAMIHLEKNDQQARTCTIQYYR